MRRGSVVRDGNRWRAMLDIGAPGGKRRWKRRGVTIADPDDPASVEAARQEAERLLEELRADYATLTTDVKSVGQLLALWVDEQAQRQADGELEASSYSHVERTVRLHVLPHLGRAPLGTFSPADVLAWQRRLARQEPPLSPAMRGKALQVLKQALRWGVRMQLVETSAAEPVDPPRTSGDHGRAASLAEVQRLCAHPSRHRWLFVVLSGLGLRIGEALGLAWADVDLDARMVKVGQQLQRERPGPDGPREWVRRPPKGRKVRSVPLPGFVVHALHEQHVQQAGQRTAVEAAGMEWEDQWGLVFTGDTGAPLHASGVGRALAKVCDELGIDRLTPHDLRRSCSSLLASRGVPTRVRMAVLGHSTSRLTEDVYTRAYDPDVVSAMDGLDDAVVGGIQDRPSRVSQREGWDTAGNGETPA